MLQRGRPKASVPPAHQLWQRLEPAHGWGELVLPAGTLEQLLEVPALLGKRWWEGAATDRARAGRRGVLVLFRGRAGTGKTTAARVLGAKLRLPVLQVDIGSLFARRRGEAMAQVARVFAAADRLVLVLDNSDALLAAAHAADGGAPLVATIDVCDLLRRGQAHPGIVVVPSTFNGELDADILARFDRVIEFPMPPWPARAELWRRSLGGCAAASEDDVALLADAFVLAGKDIKECCAGAKAAAARQGEELGLAHLLVVLERASRGSPTGATEQAALTELRRREQAAKGAPVSVASAQSPPPEPSALPLPTMVRGEPSPASNSQRGVNVGAGPAQAHTTTLAHTMTLPHTTTLPPASMPPPRPDSAARAADAWQTAASGQARRARLLLPVALVGALAAVVFVLAATRRGSAGPAHLVFDRSVTAGPVTIAYPSGWTKASVPPLPGLGLSHAIALSSHGAPAGEMVIGSASPGVATPLPFQFLARTVTDNPTPELIVLGTHRFYRMLDPRLGLGARSESVYALSTAGGPVIALCRTTSEAFETTCERILATLVATAATPTPSFIYAQKLSAILTGLNRARGPAAAALAGARHTLDRARAAAALATLHRQAAATVATLPAGAAGRANAALAAALARLGDAYGALSAAAAHDRGGGYAAAQRAVGSAGAGVGSALGNLRALGYNIQ